jgi:hypothetical protein
VAKVTLEVPEALLGDIYVAVGFVLERARLEGLLERDHVEADQGAGQTAAPEPGQSKQVPAEA